MQDEIETARAFWSTLAQIAGVFIIPLVLEARRSAARWRGKPRGTQVGQAIFYYYSGSVLFLAIFFPLLALGRAAPLDPLPRLTFPILLGTVAAGLVLIPLAKYFVITTREVTTIIVRFMPWSSWRDMRRRYRRAWAAFVDSTVELLEARDELANVIAQIPDVETDLKKTAKKVSTELDKRSEQAATTGEPVDAEWLATVTDGQERLRAHKATLKRAKRTSLRQLRSVDERIVKSEKMLEELIADQDKFVKMTYVSDELRAAVDEQIAELESDARDLFESSARLTSQVMASREATESFAAAGPTEPIPPRPEASDRGPSRSA